MKVNYIPGSSFFESSTGAGLGSSDVALSPVDSRGCGLSPPVSATGSAGASRVVGGGSLFSIGFASLLSTFGSSPALSLEPSCEFPSSPPSGGCGTSSVCFVSPPSHSTASSLLSVALGLSSV